MARAIEINYGPVLRGRYYTSAGDRRDHSIGVFAEVECLSSRQLIWSARSKLGRTMSSDANYRCLFLDLSADNNWEFSPGWSWFNELGLRQASFSDRAISETTLVSNRRRIGQLRTETAKETYSTTFPYSELLRQLREDIDTAASFGHTRHTSRSGRRDWSLGFLAAERDARRRA